MTCAKKKVECKIVCRDGAFYIGTNDCAVPQGVCPREQGEGYEKCGSICQQEGHAEQMAVKAALDDGVDLTGAVAYLSGINHFCKPCQQLLYGVGIRCLRFVE